LKVAIFPLRDRDCLLASCTTRVVWRGRVLGALSLLRFPLLVVCDSLSARDIALHLCDASSQLLFGVLQARVLVV